MTDLEPDVPTASLVHRDLVAGRYLTARARLLAAGEERLVDLWNVWFWTLNAIDPWHEGWPVQAGEPQAPAATLAAAEPDGLVVAAELAAEAVRHGRVVVLMERHALPETRWAGVRLLPALRRAGATHLAFEAWLQEPLDRARRERVVRAETAPYAYDPSRAALLRTAIALGLELVAFDHPTDAGQPIDSNAARERWMAENVRRLAERPGARVVVWTGGQHAWKRVPSHFEVPLFASWAGDRTMAELLDDPFCVGQAVLQEPPPGDPGIVLADHPWAAGHGLDAVLVHARGGTPRRPSWIDEGRRPVAFPAAGARLVQAFPEAEGLEAVPADQALARGGGVTLTLPPGRYRCRGVDDADWPIWQRSLQLRP
jgi:hypothetical protein